MFKNFLMKKMLQSKMKDVPVAEQEKMLAMIEKDPQLSQKIALEIKQKMDAGADQMQATMEITQKYRDQLQELMK